MQAPSSFEPFADERARLRDIASDRRRAWPIFQAPRKQRPPESARTFQKFLVTNMGKSPAGKTRTAGRNGGRESMRTSSACLRGVGRADDRRLGRDDRRQHVGARQFSDGAAERHCRRRREGGRRSADRSGREGSGQAAQPDPEFHRFRRRCDHRQPGRHGRDLRSDGAGGRGRHSARLREPRAGQSRHPARQPDLRRLGRERLRHARDRRRSAGCSRKRARKAAPTSSS